MVKNKDLEKDFDFYWRKDWKKINYQKHGENRFCWINCPNGIYDGIPWCRPYDCEFFYKKPYDLYKNTEFGEVLTLYFFEKNYLDKRDYAPPDISYNTGDVYFAFPYLFGSITIWQNKKIKILLKNYEKQKKDPEIFLYYHTPFPDYKKLISVELPKDNPYYRRCVQTIDNPCVQTSYEMRGYLRKYITVDWEDFKDLILSGFPRDLRNGTCLNDRLLNKNRQSMIEMVERRKNTI